VPQGRRDAIWPSLNLLLFTREIAGRLKGLRRLGAALQAVAGVILHRHGCCHSERSVIQIRVLAAADLSGFGQIG